MMLISLQDAAEHLRLDTHDDDADLTLKIQAASASVIRYLDGTSPFVMDESGIPTEEALPEVRMAVLQMVGELYKNREGDMGGQIASNYGYGYLPQAVVSLLYPLRKPSMA